MALGINGDWNMILIEIHRKKIQIEYKAMDLKLLNDINSYNKMWLFKQWFDKPSKINSHEYLHMNLSVYLSDK